jgi:hypothetical protein
MDDMEPSLLRTTGSRFRSQLALRKGSLWAAVLTALLFLLLNRNGCWFYRHESRDLILFAYVFVWLLTFLTLTTIWRVILLVGTVVVLIPLVGLRDAEMNAVPEATAVHALRDISSRIQQTNPGKQTFPESVSTLDLPPLARKLYTFEYIPARSQGGEIRNYRIEAVPCHRGCDLEKSFTITSDNRIFWTSEGRPATASDHLLEP